MVAIGVINLCPPALFYITISTIAIIIMLIQNFGGKNVYCLGEYTCDVPGLKVIFLIKIIYVIFWTWLLNVICSLGHTEISWFLVFLPFILMYIFILYIFFININIRNMFNTFSGYTTVSRYFNGPSQTYNAINNWLYF